MRKVLLLLIVFFLSAHLAAFAEDKPQGSSQDASSPAAQAQSTPEEFITAIEVKGNKAISSNTIISKLKSRIGAAYQENVVSDDLKRLYLLGYFSDIKIDTEKYKNGLKLIVSVVERPLLAHITFSGIRRLTMKDEKLKESLKSKESQYLDYPSLDEDVGTLRKMYEKKGFSQTEITYKVDLNKETNKADVQFAVVEGKRIHVRDIYIKGNKSFTKRRILGLLKTKRGWLFNAGILKEEVLKEDIERVKSFYHNQGFADVEVEYGTQIDAKRPFLYIQIKINEGKKYLVGNVSIDGNKEIAEKEIISKLKACLPGRVFSQDGLKQDIANIQSVYFDKGYIMAQVQEATAVNSSSGRVDVSYHIKENDIAYVNKIKIRGNVKTRDLVIRRELRIHPGDKFDGQKLRRSKERLQNLGFFDEISYDTEDTATPDKKDLIVDVKEAKTGAFSFGGGYSTVEQFVGFVEIEQKNFDWKNFPYFTGAGQDLKMRASFGSINQGYNLSFTEPWLFDYPVSFGFDVYKEIHERDQDVGYGYDQNVTGGDLRLGNEISEYLKQNLTYRYDNIRISNLSSDATSDLTDELGSNSISSMQYDLNFDTRDNVFDTTRGDLLTGSYQLAGGPFGGDKDFNKFLGRASHYIPFFANSSLELRGRLGLAKPYSNSTKVPIYERFFAGGAYTIRGYRERKVGPIDQGSGDPKGGDSMLIGNAEYTYPVLSFMKLATFYDIGNVWDKAGDIGAGGFKSGMGLGVRIKTPIGPIMLDYGLPLNKETGDDKKGGGKFYFSMSHGF
ncbi:MAG: outer membrane protein assembly factor BamA [Candidatus Omnitrophica bacterium]|nr:outer membrane protein assembly factor BamA [Candidatus Omnitrophota bacterium]